MIYASITGFGAGGGAHLPGYDLIVEAMSGLMSLQGDADGQPYRAGIAIFDVMSGLQTAIGILAALDHRRRTGEGQLVEVNLMAAALAGMVNQTGAFASAGVVPHRMGNSHPSLFPYEPLPTGDGDLVIAAGNDAQFRNLCAVLGAPELGTDERFAANSGRTANRDQLRPLLIERLKNRPASEWFDRLIAAGVPCGPINSRRRRCRVRRADRPGPGSAGGARRVCGPRHPQSADVLRHGAALRPAAALARRARQADPRVARRPGPPPAAVAVAGPPPARSASATMRAAIRLPTAGHCGQPSEGGAAAICGTVVHGAEQELPN